MLTLARMARDQSPFRLCYAQAEPRSRAPSQKPVFLVHGTYSHRGPEDHMNKRILHSSPKAQYKGDSRNHGLQGPYV